MGERFAPKRHYLENATVGVSVGWDLFERKLLNLDNCLWMEWILVSLWRFMIGKGVEMDFSLAQNNEEHNEREPLH